MLLVSDFKIEVGKTMDKYSVVSARIPEEVYKEFALRIPEGERSDFIRDSIMEKLQRVPRPDKLFELEKKVKDLEIGLAEIRKYLTDLEVLTFDKGKANPHAFCLDETDHRIVDYLLSYKGATTPELADYLKTNRWHILNRLRKMQKRSKTQLGKSIIDYYAGERFGKKKAWWLLPEVSEM
jgi:hypothetical protein